MPLLTSASSSAVKKFDGRCASVALSLADRHNAWPLAVEDTDALAVAVAAAPADVPVSAGNDRRFVAANDGGRYDMLESSSNKESMSMDLVLWCRGGAGADVATGAGTTAVFEVAAAAAAGGFGSTGAEMASLAFPASELCPLQAVPGVHSAAVDVVVRAQASGGAVRSAGCDDRETGSTTGDEDESDERGFGEPPGLLPVVTIDAVELLSVAVCETASTEEGGGPDSQGGTPGVGIGVPASFGGFTQLISAVGSTASSESDDTTIFSVSRILGRVTSDTHPGFVSTKDGSSPIVFYTSKTTPKPTTKSLGRECPGSRQEICVTLSAVCCLLSAVCCLLPAVCCLLSAVCCLLSAVCCLLSAVCCLLSVTCSFYRDGNYDKMRSFTSVDGPTTTT